MSGDGNEAKQILRATWTESSRGLTRWNQNQFPSWLTITFHSLKPYLQASSSESARKCEKMARNSVLLRHLLRFSPSSRARSSSLIETLASSPIAVPSPPIHTISSFFTTATANSQFSRPCLNYRTLCSSSGTSHFPCNFSFTCFIFHFHFRRHLSSCYCFAWKNMILGFVFRNQTAVFIVSIRSNLRFRVYILCINHCF